MESGTVASTAPTVTRALPTGTTAFLFTDIEGSTVRWDRDPAAMQIAVRRHDAIMRAAIDAADGVVFKTIGDAFCAVFWRPADALKAAITAQHDLAAEDFAAVGGVRVRMAVHVGESDERDADYFGPTLNRVARLLAIGHGGQILLSEAAAEAAGAALPDAVTLRDLGDHRLKDLTAPEHVFQADAPDLPSSFPDLRSLSVLDNNLPQHVTELVGRAAPIAQVKAALERERLVTLLGTGGLGKTRCAVQIGAELLDRFADGVWFVDLAPLADASLVPNTIAAVFDVKETTTKPMLETLADALRGKRALLILDNCEHVVAASSKAAAALLHACPNVRIIATSREALGIAAEYVFRLPPLAVPPATKRLTASAASAYGAVTLFEVRARAANGHFAVTDENAPAVADLCRRLDGIPLAIELAAARLKMLSVTDLAKRLDQRLRLLTGGDRNALPRQQTLRALIDWSYDSLSEQEQALFRVLSVFAGGFAFETAGAVSDPDATDDIDVLENLASLVDKSLVGVETFLGETRYRLLESTRAYAAEKLTECGEADRVANLHAAAYAAVAEKHELDYESSPSEAWLARVEFDLENVRTALTWSFGRGDALTGQRIAATLGRILLSFAAAEARRWVTTSLQRVDEATPALVVARLHLADAALSSVLNEFKISLAAAERATAAFAAIDDRRGGAEAQRFAGRAMVRMGRAPEGEALLRTSLATLEALGSHRLGGTLRDLGVARSIQGDLEGARAFFERALTAFRRFEDDENVAITAAALAEAEYACGNPEAALQCAQDALDAIRGFRRERMEAALLANIAAYLIALGCHDLAQAHAEPALRLARDVDAGYWIATALGHLAAVGALRPYDDEHAALAGAERAARIVGFVDAKLAALDADREHTEQQVHDATMEALRQRLPPEAVIRLLDEGRAWTLQRALEAAGVGHQPALP